MTPATHDQVLLEGGVFRMGSDEFYPDEQPVHEREVGAFRIDRYAVTNAQYAAFVDETGTAPGMFATQ